MIAEYLSDRWALLCNIKVLEDILSQQIFPLEGSISLGITRDIITFTLFSVSTASVFFDNTEVTMINLS